MRRTHQRVAEKNTARHSDYDDRIAAYSGRDKMWGNTTGRENVAAVCVSVRERKTEGEGEKSRVQ